MSTTPRTRHHAITSQHLDRIAYVYIRQSTMLQVRNNTASTERQYQLRQRADDLGWLQEQIIVIDDDLGLSGASSADRPGFQRLVLDVSLERVGAVLALEVSRLARSSRDGSRLIELCALTNCLVIDDDGVYEPNNINDRLVLGLKGTISEYELHRIKTRMLQGKLHKAQQGQLRVRLPVGYVYDATKQAVCDPDEQVQQAIRLAFDLFEQLGSAWAVVKTFRTQHLLFPTRHFGGSHHGQLTWSPLRSGRLFQLLHNPTYAGAYVYGRTITRKAPSLSADTPPIRTRQVSPDQWPIVIHDHYPAYISWNQFLSNQARLNDNRTNRDTPRRGAVREGAALLQGIMICGCCGRRMTVRYQKNGGAVYVCSALRKELTRPTCQSSVGLPIEQAVSETFLHTITPVQLDLALRTLEHLEQHALQIDQQWQRQLERVRYEADRAHHQFDLADPENRLVVRTLERAWEEKLRDVQRLQREYEARPRPKVLTLTEQERQHMLHLAQDIPAIWSAPTTTNQDRKRMLRLLIADVTVTKNDANIRIAIRWQTNATTNLTIPRPLPGSQKRKNPPALIEQVRRLATTHTDRQIVAQLNQEGIKSATGQTITLKMVKWIRWTYKIPTTCPSGITTKHANQRGDGRYSARRAAQLLNVTPVTIIQWCKQGILDGIQEVPRGPWWIRLDPQRIKELQRPAPRKRHGSHQQQHAGTSTAPTDPETDSSVRADLPTNGASRKPRSPSRKNLHPTALSPSCPKARAQEPKHAQSCSLATGTTQESIQSQAASTGQPKENTNRGR